MSGHATWRRLAACTMTGVGATAAIAAGGAPVPYVLGDGSTFQRGCFETCACPISIAPLSGTFALEPIQVTGTLDEYAVTDVEWEIGFDPPVPVTGSGTLTRFSEFVVVQTLELDLVIGDEPVEHFTSGAVVVPGAQFPDIEMMVNMNDLICFDTVFTIVAHPAPPAACPADVSHDGVVNFADVLMLISAWGPCAGVPCAADVNGDGEVTFADVIALLGSWGPCP